MPSPSVSVDATVTLSFGEVNFCLSPSATVGASSSADHNVISISNICEREVFINLDNFTGTLRVKKCSSASAAESLGNNERGAYAVAGRQQQQEQQQQEEQQAKGVELIAPHSIHHRNDPSGGTSSINNNNKKSNNNNNNERGTIIPKKNGGPATSPTSATTRLQQQQQILPTGWRAAIDGTTGKQYYFHRASGKISWKRPPSSSSFSTGNNNKGSSSSRNGAVEVLRRKREQQQMSQDDCDNDAPQKKRTRRGFAVEDSDDGDDNDDSVVVDNKKEDAADDNDGSKVVINPHLYRHSDGQYRRVPVGWKFPKKMTLQSMYAYWHIGGHIGDVRQQIPPMKCLENSDVKQLGKRARTTLSEIRKVMGLIDKRATDRGLTVKRDMTHVEVNSLFNQGMSVIGDMIDAATPTNRHRNISKLKISTVVTYIQDKRKKDRVASVRSDL